ncbi:MAG: carboxypeptidase regulatory-like domain-containing protein [Gemmatimonadota bacterium]|nr:carboxypeptidase regulatory-like domain-containing protein [Gemmatimonadota bacterium]
MKRHVFVAAIAALSFACYASGDAVAGATVSGTIKLELPGGKKPGRKKIQMAADPVCAGKHAGGATLSEVVLVDDDGGLHNVFVYVKSGLEGKTFDAPSEPAVLDQKGCIYKPRVMGVRAGQPITVLNSDGTLHNIHPKPQNSAEINKAMPKFMKKTTISFANSEVMVPVKCDVHPWMQSYIGVMEHPFFAVTGEGGKFEIKGLPAGTYTIEAWHESKRLGTMTQEVTVADGESRSLDFTFKIKPRKK